MWHQDDNKMFMLAENSVSMLAMRSDRPDQQTWRVQLSNGVKLTSYVATQYLIHACGQLDGSALLVSLTTKNGNIVMQKTIKEAAKCHALAPNPSNNDLLALIMLHNKPTVLLLSQKGQL